MATPSLQDQIELIARYIVADLQGNEKGRMMRARAFGLYPDTSGNAAEESLRVLAKACGVEPSVIESWELGETRPAAGQGLRWAATLAETQLLNVAFPNRGTVAGAGDLK